MKNTKSRSEKFVLNLLNENRNSGFTLLELSKKYKTDASYQLRKAKLKCLTSGELRKLNRVGCYKLNSNFQSVTNEQEAYILGIWFADGYVNSEQAGLVLHSSDTKLVKAVRDYISKDIPVVKVPKTNGVKLVVSSQEFCNNLKLLGCVSNKTYCHLSIPNIPNNLVRHFIRGYFDGDGTIYYDANYLRFNICSIRDRILKEFEFEFAKEGIYSNINTEVRKGVRLKLPEGTYTTKCENMHRLFVRNADGLYKLYHYLYDDSTIFMERKRKKWKNYVNTVLTDKLNVESVV